MFDLELNKVIEKVKEKNPKTVCVQLPDGLKPKAKEVVDKIEEATGAEVYIWLGSCFGACDLPLGLKALDIDLMVQFGHNVYHKSSKGW